MAGELLADDNSPMMMTVGQYNERVAYTWKLATEAENQRVVGLLQDKYSALTQANCWAESNHYLEAMTIIKAETNGN
jgi:hypothetical protein